MKTNKLLAELFLLIFAGTALILIHTQFAPTLVIQDDPVAEVIEAEPVSYYFGFPEDSFDIEKGIVQRNQYLADILLKQGIDYASIDRIARNARDVFDVRKIRRGQPYHILKSRDSLPKALYFIYEITPEEYTVFELRDSLKCYLGRRPVSIKTDTISGVIESSLWNTMTDNGQNPMLAIKMSEVYQWAIDFFGIQKGDSYQLIYENQFIDTLNIGTGKILAAAFEHANSVYYAFWYKQDSLKGGDYFDEEANSLRRTFLKAPLRFSRISSRFSHSRMHPVLKIRRPHHGVDYAAPTGTPVHTIGDGVVIKKGYQRRGGGRYIKIKHNSVYTTVYMHLNGYARGIKTGQRVKQGDLIGYVGSTGLATGPHLDFRVYRNGSAMDPLKMESPPAKPVDSAYREDYFNFIRPTLDYLNLKKPSDTTIASAMGN